jgi:SNF2 family DNA or RNA helicase
VDELWALLHFIEPKLFNDRSGFTAQFGSLQKLNPDGSAAPVQIVAELHDVMRPFMLRRLKDEGTLPLYHYDIT